MLPSVLHGPSKSTTHSYREAVNTLNSLQSNSAYVKNVRKKRQHPSTSSSLKDTIKYLNRLGIRKEELARLSVIHVAGTKGKGSTCAFVESILQAHGYRTGFFSSPHLISVRERFKINGQPIGESQFSNYFWKVYNTLESQKENTDDRPKYFQMLTLIMFDLFLEANLDVAIIEVGVGGEFDCTNAVQDPVCTGITSLALDHVSVLGDTIEAIAYQKSGIFKKSSPAFTVAQCAEAIEVLEKRAREKGCSLSLVDGVLDDYCWPNGSSPMLGIESEIQASNASLAIQLSNCWIATTQFNSNHSRSQQLVLSLEATYRAISSCRWPGRTQLLKGKMADFYLDGAHTVESIDNCANWFHKHTANSCANKYLIFNVTNGRDHAKFIQVLKRLRFDKVYLAPNTADSSANNIDQNNFNDPLNEQMERCQAIQNTWGEVSLVTNSVGEALRLIATQQHDNKPNVLITGSLHLVGAALFILDPHFQMKTAY